MPGKLPINIMATVRSASAASSSHRMPLGGSPFRFAQFDISPDQVFVSSKLSFAFVNLKPIVPGHVLVAPRRVEPRFANLTSEEVGDLWTLSQQVGTGICKHFHAEALTLTVQDGPAAGQSVPHVHVHVLPRRAGDFEPNDKIYDVLDKETVSREEKKSNLDEDRVPRTADEMAKEASDLKAVFTEASTP